MIFRGCETNHCITFVQQDDKIGSHIFIEIITRAISKLDLLIYPKSKSHSNNSECFHGALEAWMNQKGLVDVCHLYSKDVDSESNDGEDTIFMMKRNDEDFCVLKPVLVDVDYEQVRQNIIEDTFPFDYKILTETING